MDHPLPTSTTMYFINKAGRLALDPRGFVRLDWAPGPRDAADFQGLLHHALGALRRSGAGGLLRVQGGGMSPFTAAEQQWLHASWGPALRAQASRCCHALVTAKHWQARLVTAQVEAGLRHEALACKCFEDEGFAIVWLQAQAAAAAVH